MLNILKLVEKNGVSITIYRIAYCHTIEGEIRLDVSVVVSIYGRSWLVYSQGPDSLPLSISYDGAALYRNEQSNQLLSYVKAKETNLSVIFMNKMK